jgi:hypothetical protein
VQATARQYQARADDVLSTWNIRAPQYVAGESLMEYRRRLCRLAQRQLSDDHKLSGVRLKMRDAFGRRDCVGAHSSRTSP